MADGVLGENVLHRRNNCVVFKDIRKFSKILTQWLVERNQLSSLIFDNVLRKYRIVAHKLYNNI
jgi:hypothetical protein